MKNLEHKILTINEIRRYFLIFLLIVLSNLGCKKLVQVDGPNTSISSKNVYNNNATACGVLGGLYSNLAGENIIGGTEMSSLSLVGSLSADELSMYSGSNNSMLSVYYENALTNLNLGGEDFWNRTYKRIFVVNSAIEGLTASSSLTPAVKQQLLGESKFMRAFYYFYLTNLYGDIPLVLNTDYNINSKIKKSAQADIYEQIVSDLKNAQVLLSVNYLKGDALTPYSTGSEERVRPTKWAATALLARTYLYMKEWASSEKQATLVLDNSGQFNLESLGSAFLKNNKEAIWQVQQTTVIGRNTWDAFNFVLPESGPGTFNPVYLSPYFVNKFEDKDKRKSNWIGSVTSSNVTYYFPFKYKVNKLLSPASEYLTVIRLAELYIIRAEARLRQLDLGGAISDIDVIRRRAGLSTLIDTNPGIQGDNLLKEILNEKQLEFFTEWGHRWLDLKRTGTIDHVMSEVTPKKTNGNPWKSYQKLYPIYKVELDANPNLTQNQGY